MAYFGCVLIQVIMEHLATETLLNIFRFIDNGLTILDCVSLVCSRWNSVAKDPRAWAGVIVKVSSPIPVL